MGGSCVLVNDTKTRCPDCDQVDSEQQTRGKMCSRSITACEGATPTKHLRRVREARCQCQHSLRHLRDRNLKRKNAGYFPSGTHRLEVCGVQSESLSNPESSTDGPVELESIEPTGLAHGRDLCKGSSATAQKFQSLENRFVNRRFAHVRVRHPQRPTPTTSEALASSGGAG